MSKLQGRPSKISSSAVPQIWVCITAWPLLTLRCENKHPVPPVDLPLGLGLQDLGHEECAVLLLTQVQTDMEFSLSNNLAVGLSVFLKHVSYF